MRKLIFTLLVTCISCIAFAQEPSIQWQRTIGGDLDDALTSIQPTLDGGYIIGGYSGSSISGEKDDTLRGGVGFGVDYWIIKLDAAGNIQWQKDMGSFSFDYLYTVKQTADSGFILCGISQGEDDGDKNEPNRGGAIYDGWVIKLSKAGSIVWQKTYGGSGYDGTGLFVNGTFGGDEILIESFPATINIEQTTDKGYIMGMASASGANGEKIDTNRTSPSAFPFPVIPDYWILKLNASGGIQWQKTYGGESVDALTSIKQASDGGYIVGGVSASGANGDKVDTNTYGANVSLMDMIGSPDGIKYLDYWILKLENNGSIQWQKTIGGDSADVLVSLIPTMDGGYMAAGSSKSEGRGQKTDTSRGGWDYWVVKLDANGSIQWQKTIGGSEHDYLYSAVQTTDSGYVLAGTSLSDSSGDKTTHRKGTMSDYWIVKIDKAGTIQWQKTLGGNNETMLEAATAIMQTPDGDYVVGGVSTAGNTGDKSEVCRGERDYWILKLECKVDTAISVSGHTATAAQNGTYQWINCTTHQPVPGATGKSFTPTADGDYAAVVTSVQGCHDTSGCRTIQGTAGVSSMNSALDNMIVYPNPAQNTVTIVNERSKIEQVKLINIVGAVVYESNMPNSTKHIIDISKLANGTYVLQITTAGNIINRKLEILK